MHHNPHDYPTVIIDNGSGTIKSGLAGDEAPKFVTPTFIGYPKELTENSLSFYIGDDLVTKENDLNCNIPIHRGVITNWVDIENTWTCTFDRLGVTSRNCNILLSDAPWGTSTACDREKISELMFETFHVERFHISSTSPLSLYASGRAEGLIVEIGHGLSSCAPVSYGFVKRPAVMKNELAGDDVTCILKSFLLKQNEKIDKIDFKRIKEKYCRVAFDFDREIRQDEEIKYELPDGEFIILGSEKVKCPEVFFQPDLLENSGLGVQYMICKCVESLDVDLRYQMYHNIVLSGGSTNFDGFQERLQKEMNISAPKHVIPRVIAPPDREISTWIGGSILGSLTSFIEETCWTRDSYSENGKLHVHQKCTN